MKRIKDEFLQKIETFIPLPGMAVLEIGCGQGTRSVVMAERVRSLQAIDPNTGAIRLAQEENHRPNITYRVASAEMLPFPDHQFDTAIFTLSLHHVPPKKMSQAILEAIRVAKQDGWIIFLEPGQRGNFFEAELTFDACDGDERKAKAWAYATMLSQARLSEVAELWDETVFQFDSTKDFKETMNPKKNMDVVQSFLQKNNYTLSAERRINIFRTKEK